MTECAPVIAVNCPRLRAAGFSTGLPAWRTVGQPLPGVSVRIVDPDTFALLRRDTWHVAREGSNVMNRVPQP